jgi:hypothetical protein
MLLLLTTPPITPYDIGVWHGIPGQGKPPISSPEWGLSAYEEI